MKINPESLNVPSLPSVSLEDKKMLPKIPGIYFAIDSQGTVQYIGRSTNIRNRWKHHEKYSRLKRLNLIKLAWLEIDNVLLLNEIEQALIDWFEPPFNVSGICGKKFSDIPRSGTEEFSIAVIRQIVVDAPGLGKRLKEAREKSGKSAQVLATQANISTAYWYALEKADGKKDISVSEEILRNIEQVTGIDFGVKFDD